MLEIVMVSALPIFSIVVQGGTRYIEIAVFILRLFLVDIRQNLSERALLELKNQSRIQSRFRAQWNTRFRQVSFRHENTNRQTKPPKARGSRFRAEVVK